MRLPFSSILAAVLVLTATLSLQAAPSAAPSAPLDTTIHPKATWKDSLPAGPFVRLADGALLTVDGISTLTSRDEGATWTKAPLFSEPDQYTARIERGLIRTRQNVLVLAFMNDRELNWFWDKERAEPGPDVKLPTYVVRSLDGGRTWLTPQKLHDDWTGAIRNIIECADGTLVFTTMKLLRHPGRHGCLTYRSTDGGATWTPSNLIDMGGHGHHDGALEPAIVELRDGRLWMLIRTTRGVFYQSYSTDRGLTWGQIAPTTLDASTAPAMLQRLRDGRIMLAWNRRNLEGRTEHPLRGGDNQWSERPASNQREELSIAFSTDDGGTWSAPTVLVRSKRDTSYPYLFESKPGQIWVTTMRQTVKVQLTETDFLSPAGPASPAPSAKP